MSSKFLKVIFAAVMSIGLIGQANAVTISYFEEGQNYTDADGKLWEYLGFFDLDDGPDARDGFGNLLKPISFNGLGAALELFGATGDSLEDFALSAFLFDTTQNGVISDDEISILNAFDPDHADVNHMSWYDTFNSTPGLHVASESINTKVGAQGYFENGDISAYVDDRALAGFNLNYVFRTVAVPEPSTLAIFALALLVLGARKLRH